MYVPLEKVLARSRYDSPFSAHVVCSGYGVVACNAKQRHLDVFENIGWVLNDYS